MKNFLPYLRIVFTTHIMVLFLCLSANVFGQFDCDNITCVGLYFNNYNTGHLSIVLTNSSLEDDGNGNVYTSFQIVTDEGDSLLQSPPCYCYRLPKSHRDTFVYNIKINDTYRHIYELPEQFCGKLITEFPDCSLPICYTKAELPDLPAPNAAECEAYKICGIYENISDPLYNRSMLLTYTIPDARGYGPSAYTSFEFFDSNNISLNANSGPHYTLPQFYEDTVIVHLAFHDRDIDKICGKMVTQWPDCTIEYCEDNSTGLINPPHLQMYVFPNPAYGFVHISASEPIDRIELYGIDGRLVKKSTVNKIEISELNAGTYLIKANTQSGYVLVEKIIKL